MTTENRLPYSFRAEHEKHKDFTVLGIPSAELSRDDLICACAHLIETLERQRQEALRDIEVMLLACRSAA